MKNKFNDFVDRKTSKFKNRIMNMIGRCVLAAVTDSKKLQEVKVTILEGETKEEIEHFQNYGFTSNAPGNSEGLALSLNGNRDHTVVINIDNREFRLKSLASGEVAMYSKFGNKIIMKADGSIEEACAGKTINSSGDVNVNSGHVKMSGQQTVKEDINITDQNTSISSIKSIFNNHTHPGDSGGTTGPPNTQI